MSDLHTRTIAVDALCFRALQLNADELSVLIAIADRLVMGRKQYGELNLNTDKRDWTKELHEEHLDACVYQAIRTLGRVG